MPRSPNPAVPTAVRARRTVRRVVIGLSATCALAACSSGDADTPKAADAARPAVSEGPVTGTASFAGAEEVPVTVTLPSGWETRGVFVLKSGSDPLFGLSFFDVAGIYADGCQWVLVQPPVGPTVDDLVAAYSSLPGFGGAVRDSTVDGFTGKLIEYTVPDYDPVECRSGRFGLFREDNQTGSYDGPNLWAQAPKQRNEFRILDVNGTRLVVGAGYPPDISAQDLQELHKILDSVEIG
jgi:hypothetical protein